MSRLVAESLIGIAMLAIAACSPAAEEPVSAPPQEEIESTTAPSMGGPTALPTDGGVTPAPESMEDATAEDVEAAVSPERAAKLSGGQQDPAPDA